MDEFIAANRLNWDDRAKLHSTDTTGIYRIAEVLAGGDSLHAIEAAEIGDVAGRRLVHLQCHIGLDTISLAAPRRDRDRARFLRRGDRARRAISPRAPAATSASCSRTSTTRPRRSAQTYEVAYVTWGAINWLPDIFRWAQVVADVLEPGGFLYLAESHPATLCLEEIEGRIVAALRLAHAARARRSPTDEATTYTGDARDARAPAHLQLDPPALRHRQRASQAGLRSTGCTSTSCCPTGCSR